MTYVRLPSVVHIDKPRIVVYLSDGRILCTGCGRYLAPDKFESKGRRAGRQVRRRKCVDCEALRQVVYAPRDDVNGGARTCKVCGRSWSLVEFRRCGTFLEYRLWTCRLCMNTVRRAWYARMKRRAGKGEVKPHKPYWHRPMKTRAAPVPARPEWRTAYEHPK